MPRRKTYPCRDCQAPCSRDGARCLNCHWDYREAGAKARACQACGKPRSKGAVRCASCAPAHLEGRKAPAKERESMRAAALRRHAHVEQRRRQAADLWLAGKALGEIAGIVGISPDRVAIDLDRLGVRPRRSVQRLTLADLEARIQREPSGCWTWTGTKSRRHPAGLAMVDGGRLTARQATWYRACGDVPAAPLWPTCGFKNCINPAHHRLGFQASDAPAILEAVQRGERQTVIAERYGCRRETISRLASRHRDEVMA